MRVLLCERCGAPLDAPWSELVVVCVYCGAHNLPGRPGGPVPSSAPVDGRPRLNLGGRSYVLEAKLADGDSTTVYRGRWVVRLGELVVIKVLASRADEDLLRAEWEALGELQRSRAEGASHFVTRLPTPVAHGVVSADEPRRASVFGWKSGFVHTLADVERAYPSGVPGPAVVWLLKRLLELLGFVHRSGWVHAAVTPDHVLVHPRDHGAMLVGWTSATTRRHPVARPRAWTPLYQGLGAEATPALDVAMACRCVRASAGWLLPGVVAPDHAVRKVIDRGADGRVDDAWALAEDLVRASREVYGPPAYHPLDLPGWRI